MINLHILNCILFAKYIWENYVRVLNVEMTIVHIFARESSQYILSYFKLNLLLCKYDFTITFVEINYIYGIYWLRIFYSIMHYQLQLSFHRIILIIKTMTHKIIILQYRIIFMGQNSNVRYFILKLLYCVLKYVNQKGNEYFKVRLIVSLRICLFN